ncbi:hypothetical protein V3528_18415, partial [Acinetobacter johnsonii]|uniref:hypothetical protein n=1 Tax=Acinetobacter johnsonii TaxID=40214 RepID=UPI0030F9D205
VYTLLAGALDVNAERGRAFGEQLGIAPERCYADYQTLFREEAQRPPFYAVKIYKFATKITKIAFSYP